MSGDRGAQVCVPAAVELLRERNDLSLVLVGAPEVIEPLLRAHRAHDEHRIEIQPASEIVGMNESPREALRRKKDSSMRRAIDMVKEGRAQACVSAGNTGALMATAHFVLKSIPGIDRPAIMSAIPGIGGHTHMLDLGANASCTPEQLCQFGVMGSVVAADLNALERPRVGLLNIGEEDIKGHTLVQEAHRLLAATTLNYVGFVEGDDIFTGEVDVVVTDGFTGNVALKTMEGPGAHDRQCDARRVLEGGCTQGHGGCGLAGVARAQDTARSASLQWGQHGRIEGHRHQESRRGGSIRIPACHPHGGN